ncbi:MAG: SprT family zinc-dependent metalloprotease [Bacteroidota bacterium]
MNKLQIDKHEIPFGIERSQGKRISLRFKAESDMLILKTPDGRLSSQAKSFIQQKERWILRTFLRIQAMQDKKREFWELLRKGKVWYLGTEYTVRIHRARAFSVQVKEQEIYLGLRGVEGPRITVDILKKMLIHLAKEYLIPQTQTWARQTDSWVNKIFIKDQRSKWGSCSGKRNINLNWHLILLPPPLIDYLIVHELMHLREMNHSPAYWRWVARYYPSYKEAQKALHTYDWVIGVLDKQW